MSGEDNLLKLVEAATSRSRRTTIVSQEQVGFILRKAHQRHVSIFAAHIADLTPPQFAALAKLRDVGETSQNQLGTLIAMDAATVKGVIDRLKARGYVALSRHEVDKRRLLVSLTAAGHDGDRCADPGSAGHQPRDDGGAHPSRGRNAAQALEQAHLEPIRAAPELCLLLCNTPAYHPPTW